MVQASYSMYPFINNCIKLHFHVIGFRVLRMLCGNFRTEACAPTTLKYGVHGPTCLWPLPRPFKLASNAYHTFIHNPVSGFTRIQSTTIMQASVLMSVWNYQIINDLRNDASQELWDMSYSQVEIMGCCQSLWKLNCHTMHSSGTCVLVSSLTHLRGCRNRF